MAKVLDGPNSVAHCALIIREGRSQAGGGAGTGIGSTGASAIASRANAPICFSRAVIYSSISWFSFVSAAIRPRKNSCTVSSPRRFD